MTQALPIQRRNLGREKKEEEVDAPVEEMNFMTPRKMLEVYNMKNINHYPWQKSSRQSKKDINRTKLDKEAILKQDIHQIIQCQITFLCKIIFTINLQIILLKIIISNRMKKTSLSSTIQWIIHPNQESTEPPKINHNYL